MEEEKIFIVAGLGFGDEGKGSIVDFLTKRYDAKYIFRYNGGPQAAHYVFTTKGVLHCFAQFGSGTFFGARTYLSEYMLVDPIKLKDEAKTLKKKGLKNPLKLITIDPNCLVVTPFHSVINRMREIARGENRHGSCGFGVGETVRDGRSFGQMAIRAGDLAERAILRNKLDFLWRMKIDIAEQIVAEHSEISELHKLLKKLKDEKYVNRLVSFYYSFAKKSGVSIREKNKEEISGSIVFEGAQGLLLDEMRGLYPHITHSCTTFKNALDKIQSMKLSGKILKMGVLRAYSTRHGAGPFVAEDEWLTREIPDCNNVTNEWQGVFRIGWFDLVAARYALKAAGNIDCLALTNFDRLNFESIKVCDAYEYVGKTDHLLEQFFELEEMDGRSVIKRIRLPSETSWKYQSRLTELLKDCKPVYREVRKDEYIHFLEKELNIKISILSQGPKAEDKIELRPL